jgi:hypothetical protein
MTLDLPVKPVQIPSPQHLAAQWFGIGARVAGGAEEEKETEIIMGLY